MSKAKPTSNEFRKQYYGVLVIENTNSNPNGDPENDGAPRVFPETGTMGTTGVSIKRKVRDHIHRRTPTFLAVCEQLGISQKESEDRFNVFVESSRTAADCAKEYMKDPEGFFNKNVDARLFGATLLSESSQVPAELRGKIKAGGPIFVGISESLQPVEIYTGTNTRAQGMDGEKRCDIAPNSMKLARYGLMVGRFGFSPDTAKENHTTQQDVDLFFALLPHVFNFKAANRSGTEVLQLWILEKPLTLPLSHAKFEELVRPKFVGENPNMPASGRQDYTLASEADVRKTLAEMTQGNETVVLKVIDLA